MEILEAAQFREKNKKGIAATSNIILNDNHHNKNEFMSQKLIEELQSLFLNFLFYENGKGWALIISLKVKAKKFFLLTC